MAEVGDSSPIPRGATASTSTQRTACEQLQEDVDIVRRLYHKTDRFFAHFRELRFADPNYSNRDLMLRGLPNLATSFQQWQSLSSEERLTSMRHNLQLFWPFLNELEVDEGEAVLRHDGRLEEKLSRQLHNVLAHTRSLMQAISTTMELMSVDRDETDNSTPAPVHLTEPQSEYDRSIKHYIIIRDFHDFLRKANRDITFIRSENGCRRKTTRSPTHTDGQS